MPRSSFSGLSDSSDDPNAWRPLSPGRRTRQATWLTRANSFFHTSTPTWLSNGSALSRASSFSATWTWTRTRTRTRTTTTKKRKWKGWLQRQRGAMLGLLVILLVFFVVNSWILFRIRDSGRPTEIKLEYLKMNSSTVSIKDELVKLGKGGRRQKTIYARLLGMASHALAEGQKKPEPKDLWVEPYIRAASWKPCADQHEWKPSAGNYGYIMVTANGGINQQRVAICNAVAVARLLNATLVIPKLMYSSVWRDTSQFGDIYQEEYFIDYLKRDVQIVKELPKELQSLDLDAIGSVVTDADIMKEAKPGFYKKHILPILLRNGVVHLVGFGNRLASDPIPFEVQRLRCRCNFHALRFVPIIQETGALLIRRMRKNVTRLGPLDNYLLGPFAKVENSTQKRRSVKASRYLALHLRFEIDMVAHSLCEFSGGPGEHQELEAYRRQHFPGLVEITKTQT